MDERAAPLPDSGDPPLYNSRIALTYIDYLEKHHPEIDANSVLAAAGMTRLEVADPAHWFTQDQVDRFHRHLVAATRNPRISADAGRFLVYSEHMGTIKRYALGFIDPASIYGVWGRLYPLLSRGAEIQTRKKGKSAVEILSIPKAGVTEKPYQCQNRIGCFESVGRLFSTDYAHVDHPECIHRGDEACRYRVSWKRRPGLAWKSIRNLSIALDLPIALALMGFLSGTALWLAVLLLLLKSLGIAMVALFLDKQELVRTITHQGGTAQKHLDDINARYNNTLLIQEVGKAISSILNPADLFSSVVTTICNRLDFDRVLILLADPKNRRLRYADGCGFGEDAAIVRKLDFRLDNPESKGIFVRSFREQKPFIVDDIEEWKAQFSERSRRLIESVPVHSLICVPIVYERESLGILAVDTIESKRRLNQSDLNLLIGIASQLAVSINNSISYQKLKESEDRYRDIFENVSDFLYSHDLEGRILEANQAFKEATGYQGSELTALSLRDLMREEHADNFDTYIGAVIDNGLAEGITTLVAKDGTECIIEYKSSIIYHGDRPAGVRGSAHDITERWRSRKEKKRLEAMLERAQKMEAVGTLAGGVAHDLNNILSGIVGYPELLLMDLPDESPLRKPIQTIQASGHKAAAIVQDLLTMARRGVAVLDPVDLCRIVEDYLASPECEKLLANHPGTHIVSEGVVGPIYVMGSSVHLFKTVMNLVSNAAEAMPEGGTITIVIGRQNMTTPLKAYDVIEPGDYAVVSVTDTGIGISEEDQKRIFEPFYTKKVMGKSGTGLGMSVVWATVKDHKGYIDIQSCIDSGTTFTLYIPAAESVESREERNQPMSEVLGRGEQLLVVDDVKEQRDIAAAMLGKLGYQVSTVASGEEAIEHLRHEKAELVILDMIMDPGIDGLETYRQILDVNPTQKAIIASGYSESERVKTALQLGAGCYLKKPYGLKAIGTAVRRELDRPAPPRPFPS